VSSRLTGGTDAEIFSVERSGGRLEFVIGRTASPVDVPVATGWPARANDPVVRAVMRADGVNPDELARILHIPIRAGSVTTAIPRCIPMRAALANTLVAETASRRLISASGRVTTPTSRCTPIQAASALAPKARAARAANRGTAT
jgi:hypothetical protein